VFDHLPRPGATGRLDHACLHGGELRLRWGKQVHPLDALQCRIQRLTVGEFPSTISTSGPRILRAADVFRASARTGAPRRNS
jgi:hypothetical protein